MKNFLLPPVLLALACDPSGPSEGSFQLYPPEFAGDPVPCSFSLVWDDEGTEYELYRSTVAGIEADPSRALLVCVTGGTEWTDSEALEWGTGYFYAVRADEHLWSNEVSVVTPSSPYPPSCVLSMEKTGFTDCRLQWTEAEGDFSSYALLRSDHFNIGEFPHFADTVFFSSYRDSTVFTDHFASPDRPGYYAVAVSDGTGLSSFSNVLTFTPGGDIPWRISFSRTVYGLQARNYQITSSPSVITGSRPYTGYSYGRLLDTEDCSVICEAGIHPRFIAVLSTGEIFASHKTADGYRLSLFSSDFSTELISRSLPPMAHGIELEAGLLVGGSSSSFLVDRETLQTSMSFGFGFSGGFLSLDGNRVFLKSGSGVIVLDANSLSVSGSIPGYFSSVQQGNDGNIYCMNSQRVEVYHPQSLSMILQFVFPEPAGTSEAAVLPPECRYAYVPVWEGDELVIRVWDITTGETPGTVRPGKRDFTILWDLLPSPSGDYLWCLGYEADGVQGIFRISL